MTELWRPFLNIIPQNVQKADKRSHKGLLTLMTYLKRIKKYKVSKTHHNPLMRQIKY